MQQNLKIVVSVVLAFILVASLVQAYRSQRETQKQLEKLEAQVEANKNAQTSPQQPLAQPPLNQSQLNQSQSDHQSPVVIVTGSTTAPSSILAKEKSLEDINTIGWKLIDTRDSKEAEKAAVIFHEGIRTVAPDNADLYNGLGRALLVANRPVEAIAAWRKGIELNPKKSILHSGIGWAYWNLHDYARARDSWDAALEIDPGNIDAWSAMAFIDLALNKPAVAKKGFEKLVAFDRKNRTWILGLSMAQGRNCDPKQVSVLFPLPPIERFSTPLPIDPAATTQPSPSSQPGIQTN